MSVTPSMYARIANPNWENDLAAADTMAAGVTLVGVGMEGMARGVCNGGKESGKT